MLRRFDHLLGRAETSVGERGARREEMIIEGTRRSRA
jgi:hypothetical protein